MQPARRLIEKVAASLQIDKFQPMAAVLKKKISGSIEGEAIQKDMTGARGTPPINKEAITGITPHEQNGLNAPTKVAKNTETKGFLFSAFLMYLDASDIWASTANGIVMTIYGQM